jgi:hypothetical protein
MADSMIPSLPVLDSFPEGLRDASVRYRWATTHLSRLNDVLREFNDGKSWEPQQDPDLPEGMVRIKIFRSPPREIGLIIGDIVHSLRASLDYATCALVRIKDDAADLRHTYFPFGRPGVALSGAERKNLKIISDVGLSYIDEARRIGHPYLGVLNRASNQDKHRLIAAMLHRQMPMKVVIDHEANTADIVPDGERTDVWMQPLADGDVVQFGNMLALRPGFVVEGDDAPYALEVINQLFKVTHQSLCLMITAAEVMLKTKGETVWRS